MKFVSAILTVLAASASVGHARISSKEDKGYEEWGHRSLKQEATSMSMPNTTMVMLSEISEEVELDEFESTIVGGGFATPGERPYLVRVQSVQIPVPPPTGGFVRQGCGGSLITPNVVLTAAHCMYDANTGNWAPTDFVEFHRHDVNDNRGVIVMNIRNLAQVGGDVVHHPSYRVREHDFDLALIFLPMAVSGITPVTLNENSKVPATAKSAATGAPLDIAGWGEIFFDGPTSPVLKETTLNYITNKQCTSPPSSITPNRITNNMMCVAHAAGTAECRGDSGGPLVLSTGTGPATPVVQVGIVSWSEKPPVSSGCADPAYPGVYVRVSSVAGWIKSTVCARTGELCQTNKSSKARKLAN